MHESLYPLELLDAVNGMRADVAKKPDVADGKGFGTNDFTDGCGEAVNDFVDFFRKYCIKCINIRDI